MKTHRAVLILLAMSVAVAPVLASVTLPSVPDAPTDGSEEKDVVRNATYVDSGISIYKFDENDHDADVWVSVENTGTDERVMKVEITPVLNGGSTLMTHTEGKIAASGETVRVESKWNSGSDVEADIESIEVTVYVCDKSWLNPNCTEVDRYDG